MAGGNHSLALAADGVLWAWGNNDFGQLGINRAAGSRVPMQVASGYSVVDAGSTHTIALKPDGSLWAWGANEYGQLGDGSRRSSTIPVHIGDSYVAIAAGYGFSIAAKADGSLLFWGRSIAPLLNDSSSAEDRLTPVEVMPAGSGVTAVAAGLDHGLALKDDGSLWAWGNNSASQLGADSHETCGEPGAWDGPCATAPVKIGDSYQSIATTESHNLALKSDGSLWVWGDDYYGQLGDGPGTLTYAPQRIGEGYKAVAAGYGHSLALKTDGTLMAWGLNDHGQLGVASTERCGDDNPCTTTPQRVGSGFSGIAAMGNGSFAIGSDGTLLAWGFNSEDGILGLGTTTDATTPRTVGTGFVNVSPGEHHVIALKSDGTLWAWGANWYGEFGVDNGESPSLPKRVGEGYMAVAAAGDHTLVLGGDGTLWAWGRNDQGQLGVNTSGLCLGTTPCSTVPMRVSDRFVKIAAGYEHSLALDGSGALWAWGNNDAGQLGDGSRNDSAVPKQIGEGYSAIAAGWMHSVALKPDGSLWGWGGNGYGQLDDSYIDHLAPDQIAPPGSGFTAIAAGALHNLALKADGSLWAWGDNYSGELGDGSVEEAGSPRRIAEDFVAIAAAGSNSLALKRDGALWGWGNNDFGQLGPVSPDQCGGEDDPHSCIRRPMLLGTNVLSAATSGEHSLLIKRDGTLRSVGVNWGGQLGNGLVSDSAMPQIVISDRLDGFLDLDPAMPNAFAASELPPFLANAMKSGGLSNMSLSVDMRGILGNEFASLNTFASEARYSVYVAAQAKSGGLDLGWYQLEAGNQWDVLSWPLSAYLTNQQLGNRNDSVIVKILEGLDISQLIGSRIYLGYGLDAEEMLNAGRYRAIMDIQKPTQ